MDMCLYVVTFVHTVIPRSGYTFVSSFHIILNVDK